MDRGEGGRKRARERVGLDALPKRDGWNEGRGREIVKERVERERERGESQTAEMYHDGEKERAGTNGRK